MSKNSKKSSNLVEARSREGKQLRLQNFDGLDVPDKLNDCKKVLDEDGADLAYADFVLGLVSEGMGVDSSRNLRERDEEHDYNFDNEEEKEEDPDFRFVLTHLKPYEKYCVLRYDGNFIKFEEATSSDTEHDEEQGRKLRSSTKQNGGPSSMMPLLENKDMRGSHYASSSKMKSLPLGETSKYEREENGRSLTEKKVPRPTSVHPTLARKGDSSLDGDFDQERRRMSSGTKQKNGSESVRAKEKENLTRRSIRNTPKSEKEGEIIQMDPDFYKYTKYLKLINDHWAYDPPGLKRIVYELRNGEGNQVKQEPDDGSYSDVEIIDSTEFHKVGNRKFSCINHLRFTYSLYKWLTRSLLMQMNKSRNSNYVDTTEFRHKVMSALKKPFDEEEYRTLWGDIKLHLTKKRHLELRCGRERPIGTQEKGKSYLDHHPGWSREIEDIV